VTASSSRTLAPSHQRPSIRGRQGAPAFVLAVLGVGLLAGGCRDGTGPSLQGATLRIYAGPVAFDEQTLGIGETLQLTGTVLDAAGKPVPGQSVEWSSTRPDVASVDGTGMVHARAVGSTYVIAKHRVGEDTARINVAAYVTGPIECRPGEEIQLEPGEIRHLSGEQAMLLCLAGTGATGADYTLVAFNAGTTAASTLPVQIRGVGLRTAQPSPLPTLVPQTRGATLELGARFHDRLRSDVSRRLEPRMQAGVDLELVGPSRQLSVNQTVSYNVETSSGDGCSDPVMHGGRVRWVSERAIIVADTLNPSGGYTDDDYQRFATFFDEEAWPLVTANFGEPSDIDGNARVVIFFTPAVNKLKENQTGSDGSYVGGFFYNRDLFPRSGKSACAGSNVTEMVYMLVPDPQGVHGRSFSYAFVNRTTPTVLVHEFQHLVNDSRRLHVTKAPIWEQTWLNEGLSHIAEELMFYRRSGLHPRSDIGPQDLGTPAAREAFRSFQADNLERLTNFLRAPESTSAMGPDLLATRGAAWAYLRYVADRRGGSEASLWAALVRDTRLNGIENLRAALNADPLEWMRDWSVAMYVDDTTFLEAALGPRYTMPSWRFRTLYPALGTLGLGGGQRYPLRVWALSPDQPQALPLQGGSAGYVRLGVAGGERAGVRVTVGSGSANQLPPPSRLQVAVMRTR
jgi:hypothetical protein